DFVRRNAAVAGAGVCAGTSTLESAGYLSICRCLPRHGTSPPRDDPCLWRSWLVRTLQVALHSCAVVSSRSLLGLLLVGSEGNFAGRFLLGRLARTYAGVRVLPHLRCEDWNVRHADSPARLRHVRDLVRHC